VETLQQQLTVINEKLEAMHQKIEVLSTQIPELLAAARTSTSVKPLTSSAPKGL
jgi:prefoldin subunit 5